MTIERIGPIDPVQNLKKAGKTAKPKASDSADSISFSAEARSKAEIYNATELAKSAPAVRQERVEEVKRKLQDPSYISDKLIDALADRLMEYFEIT
jgi:negative regulator of flagellin synthesis FlgM